jgi:hypothetical protein
MFELLPESTQDCIGFKVSGKVTDEDYDGLLPVLDKAIAAHGTINLLVVFEDVEGWEGLEAAKADFDFGTQQYREVEKAAFVGDKKWQKWAIKLMDPFTRRTTECFFDSANLQEAWQWVEDG